MLKKAAVVLDSRADIGPSYNQVYNVGAERVNYSLFPAAGAAGSFTSQIQFQNVVVPSSDTTLVSRCPRIIYDLTVAFPAASTVKMPSQLYTGADRINMVLRDFPLQSVCSTMSLTINQQTITMQTREMLSALKRTIPKEWLKNEGSACPTCPDNLALGISDQVNAVVVIPAIAAVPYAGANVNTAIRLTSSNAFSKYENSADGWSRAAFCAKSKTSNAGIDTYVFTVSEPLLIPGLSYYDREQFLANVQSFSVVMTLANPLQDMLVCSGDVALAAPGGAGTLNPADLVVQIGATSIPHLQICTLTMSRDVVKIPPRVAYGADVPQIFSTSVGAIALNAISTQSLTSNTFTMQSMPKAILIWARQTLASRASQAAGDAWALRQPDVFLGIGDHATPQQPGQLSLQVGSKTSLLSGASAYDLWQISAKNGLNMSFQEAQRAGFPIIITPEDFGLAAGTDPMPGEFSAGLQLQATLRVTTFPFVYAGNQTGAVPCELCLMPIYEGTLYIEPQAALLEYGKLTSREISAVLSDVKRAPHLMVPSHRVPVFGSGLFSKLKGVFSSVKDAVNHPIAEKGVDLLSKLG